MFIQLGAPTVSFSFAYVLVFLACVCAWELVNVCESRKNEWLENVSTTHKVDSELTRKKNRAGQIKLD